MSRSISSSAAERGRRAVWHPPIMRGRRSLRCEERALSGREAREPQRVSRAPVEPKLLPHALPPAAADARRRAHAGQHHAAPPAGAQVFRIALVAAEELIAAIAAQHDLDVARRLAREIPRRNGRRVGKRLVEIGDEARKVIGNARGNRDREVGETEPIGSRTRERGFVERRIGKGGGEALQAVESHRREPAGDGGGIDARRQEESERTVRDRAHPDRRIERRQPRLGGRFRPPVFARFERAAREVVAEPVRGREPADVVENRARRRNGPMREIRVDAFGGKCARLSRQPRQQRARGRRESEAVVAMRIDDGLEAEPVADDVDGAPAQIENRDREHAAEPRDEVDAPVLVGVQDEFGIGTRAKDIARRLQRFGIGGPVVDFPVVRDPDVARSVLHRLVGFGPRIDDRQPRVQERIGRRRGRRLQLSRPEAHVLGIRAALAQRRHHPLRLRGRHDPLAEVARDSAHDQRFSATARNTASIRSSMRSSPKSRTARA